MQLSWSKLQEQLTKQAFIDGTPFTMSFELTARCNQKCNMCYVSLPANDKEAQVKELTADQWIQLGREARDAGMLVLLLTGGEVFLRKDFRQIYEGLLNLGLMVQVNTNGTLITEETIQWLKKAPPNKMFITLYGACHDTCAKVTGFTNSYERTTGAIDALLAAGIPVNIRTTIVKDNAHEYEQFVDFAYARDHRLGLVNYVSPRREGMNSDPHENRLAPEDMVDFENNIYAYARKMRENEEPDLDLDDPLETKDDEQQGDMGWRDEHKYPAFRCSSGRSSGWITWDGKLVGCGLISQPVAYPLEVGFAEAWNRLKEQYYQIPVCQECEECEYKDACMTCPARLFNETGAFDKAAPYLCTMAKKKKILNLK